jgi:hypothetical protein
MLIAVALGCAVAAALVVPRHFPEKAPAPIATAPPDEPAPAHEVAVAPADNSVPLPIRPLARRPSASPPLSETPTDPKPAPQSPKQSVQPARAKRPTVASATPKASGDTANTLSPKPQPDLANPDARAALSYVGTDPAAERVWANAINDPSVPQEERQNLIEDLNEDGFPDPKNITFDDLPLIVSRLDLIEQMAPGAMDDTNAAAFAEAYKDLNNMLVKLGLN